MLENVAGDYKDDFEAKLSSFSIQDKQKADELLKGAKWQLNAEQQASQKHQEIL